MAYGAESGAMTDRAKECERDEVAGDESYRMEGMRWIWSSKSGR